MPSERVPDHKFKLEAQFNLTIGLLAVKAFEARNGKYPDTLAELTPSIMKIIPQDPYDNKLIKYNSHDKILYSVGPDMTDNKGDCINDVCIKLINGR
jgi:hypothetical protein